jgi:hypothetical protein
VPGHPAGIDESAAKQHLDLGIDTAELVGGPADQCVVDRRIDAEENLAAFGHE